VSSPQKRSGLVLIIKRGIEEVEMKVMRMIQRLINEDKGISSVEYALLLALIGVGIATAAAGLGGRVATNISDATTALTP
jgi:pilus assembly protein Flp/PilA